MDLKNIADTTSLPDTETQEPRDLHQRYWCDETFFLFDDGHNTRLGIHWKITMLPPLRVHEGRAWRADDALRQGR